MDRVNQIIQIINGYQEQDSYKSYIVSPLLKELLLLNEDKNDCEIFLFAGDNYYRMGRPFLAVKYYEKALDVIIANHKNIGDLDGLLGRILRLRNYYVDDDCADVINKISESNLLSQDKIDEIKSNAFRHRRSLKHDPIEMSEEYLAVIDEVEEKVDKNRTHFGMGSCYETWNLKSQFLMEKGIYWKSPAVMNPRVMFD